MHVSYEKLWKLVKANKMTLQEMRKGAKITQATLRLMRHDEIVPMEPLLRICKVFHCDIGDIMTVIEEDL